MSTWAEPTGFQPRYSGRRLALIIAASSPPSPAHPDPDPTVVREVRMLQEVLSDPERAGFEVAVTLDQPADLVRRVVDDLVVSARYQDLLIIHILGPASFDSAANCTFLRGTAERGPRRQV